MPGVKTNERPGTRAVLRHYRMSATKARQVLDLVRGHDVDRAHEILRATPREAARVVSKVLESAVSNARTNDQLEPEELYVSACYADEGPTLKRWRPRARGRATRIRKRTCHITVIVSRMPEERLARLRARQAATSTSLRARRVAASRREQAAPDEEATPGPTADELDELDELEAEDLEEPEAEDLEEQQAEGAGETDADGEGDEVSQSGEAEELEPDEATPEPSAEAPQFEVAAEAVAEEADGEEAEDLLEEEEPAAARRRRGRAAKTAEEEQPGILRPKAPRRLRREAKAQDQTSEEGADEGGAEGSDE